MKKILSKVICLCLICAILISAVCMTVSAAAAYIGGLSTKTLKVGEQVTVTVKYDANQPIYSINGSLSYNSAVLQYVSGGSSNDGGSVKIVEALSGEIDVSYSITFKAIAAGSCYLVFSANGVNLSLQKTGVADAGVTLTVVQPSTQSTPSTPTTPSNPSTPSETQKPSSNASLSSLKVSGAKLSPTFKASTTKYTVNVDYKTEKVSISGNAIDGGTCEGLGTFNLKVGENVRYVTVTAADGKTKKTYTLTIVRAEEGTTPTEPEAPIDPLSTTIDGVAYTVVPEAPTSIPTGFTVATSTLGETEVSVLESSDGKIVLYTLKNNESGATDYYTYDKDNNEFSLLKYGVINGKMYVFADVSKGNADGYTKTTLNLGNSKITAFNPDNTDLSDFYIIYCYVDGKYGYYSYDSAENTIQRAPAFKLTEKKEEEKEVISSIKDIPKLSGEGKAVIIVLAIIVLCIIALLVLVIVRFVKLHKISNEEKFAFDNEDSIFDQVIIEDNAQNENLETLESTEE